MKSTNGKARKPKNLAKKRQAYLLHNSKQCKQMSERRAQKIKNASPKSVIEFGPPSAFHLGNLPISFGKGSPGAFSELVCGLLQMGFLPWLHCAIAAAKSGGSNTSLLLDIKISLRAPASGETPISSATPPNYREEG